MKFGTPGLPSSASDMFSGLNILKEMGLDGMEMEFVRRVFLSKDRAQLVKRKKNGLVLTAHAPYFINLASEEKAEASLKRIRLAAERCVDAGGISVVFHAGYYGKDPDKSRALILKHLETVAEWSHELGIPIRPETMGKHSQWGSWEDVMDACEHTGLWPCVDFAHLHARANGGINSKEEFRRLLEDMENRCGTDAIKHMHIHLSGIVYGEKGERKHIPIEESDMNWKELLMVLKEWGADGIIINESPNIEKDAQLYKEYWGRI